MCHARQRMSIEAQRPKKIARRIRCHWIFDPAPAFSLRTLAQKKVVWLFSRSDLAETTFRSGVVKEAELAIVFARLRPSPFRVLLLVEHLAQETRFATKKTFGVEAVGEVEMVVVEMMH